MEFGDPGAARGRRHRRQVRHIRPIHAEDEVETVEIGLRHLSGAQPGEVDAVTPADFDRTRIGRIADMPCARSRRIDFEAAGRAGGFDNVAKDGFRQGRAAYVAKADEEDRLSVFVRHV